MDFNHWYSPRNPKAIEMRKKVEATAACSPSRSTAPTTRSSSTPARSKPPSSADKAAVISALEASTWSDHFMPYGPTKFVNGQNQGGRAALLQASKTDIDVVWPNEFAGTKAVFPRPKFS